LLKIISVKYDSAENGNKDTGFNICPFMIWVIDESLTAVCMKCSKLTFTSCDSFDKKN